MATIQDMRDLHAERIAQFLRDNAGLMKRVPDFFKKEMEVMDAYDKDIQEGLTDAAAEKLTWLQENMRPV